MNKAVAAMRQLAHGDADPHGPEPDVDLQERLRLAELERDVWERTCMAAIKVLGPKGGR